MQVEHHTIDYIPETERHGNVMNLFAIWFSANAQITTIVTGALAVVLGLNLMWSIVAIIVGNAIGGIFMAYHSAQGPKLGIPQMIQSRAQFGVVGAVLPLILVIIMYLGFFSTSAVLGAQALSAALQLPQNVSLIIVNIVALVLVVYGYDIIHHFERIASILFLILFLYLSIRIAQQPSPPHVTQSHFAWGTFLLVLSIMASWQLTYAPYVADYSRYLPQDTSMKLSFWYTYLGSVSGSIWMMILGAYITFVAPKQSTNIVQYLGQLSGPHLNVLTYLLIMCGVLAINTLNVYGGFMSVVTTVTAIRPWRPTVRTRIVGTLLFAAVGTGIAIWGQGNFLDNYSKFLTLLLYFLTPWTAINLVDFYLLRHGTYVVQDIFNPDGRYGRINWIAITAYIVSILVQFPFMNTQIYTGFISKAMGGADIAWIVGLVVAALLYYVPMKKRLHQQLISQQT